MRFVRHPPLSLGGGRVRGRIYEVPAAVHWSSASGRVCGTRHEPPEWRRWPQWFGATPSPIGTGSGWLAARRGCAPRWCRTKGRYAGVARESGALGDWLTLPTTVHSNAAAGPLLAQGRFLVALQPIAQVVPLWRPSQRARLHLFTSAGGWCCCCRPPVIGIARQRICWRVHCIMDQWRRDYGAGGF